MLPIHSLPIAATRLTRMPGPAKVKARSDAPRRIRRVMEGISLWLAMLLLLFVQPIYAEANGLDGQSERPEEQSVGELQLLDAQGRKAESATLVSTDYQVDVTGLIADVHLKQTFRNPSQSWREAVFVFPLSEGATVYGLTMTAGEQRIVGEIQEKAQAREAYARAKSEGKKAAKVEQQRPNLFTTNLANIPPGETVVVELSYQQTVRYQSGLFELRLPTTLTPRYMPGKPLPLADITGYSDASGRQDWQAGWAMPTTDVPDADRISPFTVRPADLDPASHKATVAMNINAGVPVSRVSSPSHQLNNTWDGHAVEVAAGPFPMDRDLVIQWSPARGMAPSAAVFQQQWQGEDYLMAMMVPGLAPEQAMPRELIFVIDTSGSMAGESIRQAKQSLMRGLDTLGPDDWFNVIQFNSQTASLFMDPMPATGNNLSRAQRYVQNLNADGGTEMAPALNAAFRERQPGSGDERQRLRQVVFITDGSVGNEPALFRQIQQQLGRARLFTVGIGSAPNMHFMREAARYGRGTYTAINSTANIQRPLEELFGKMQSPVLTNIAVDWPDPASADNAQPARIGDLFLGEPLIQVVRGQAPTGKATVSGQLPDGSHWQQILALEKAASGRGLHRTWAREKIDTLLGANTLGTSADVAAPESGSVQEQVTALGIAHQLITPYTSFLAVEKTPSRPADALQSRDSVPTLLPAGSASGMLRYPQTATMAPLFQALGLLGLMIAAAIHLLKRRAFA